MNHTEESTTADNLVIQNTTDDTVTNTENAQDLFETCHGSKSKLLVMCIGLRTGDAHENDKKIRDFGKNLSK